MKRTTVTAWFYPKSGAILHGEPRRISAGQVVNIIHDHGARVLVQAADDRNGAAGWLAWMDADRLENGEPQLAGMEA